ncbi:MAG: flgL [Rhodocyclaceae bacterium]|nr:flgL [Rhodocyclaceae bacterium]
MRVSTSQIFDSGTLSIQRNQSSLFKLQNQLSTGRRILAPEDDPIGASEALNVSQSISMNAQLLDNQGNAANQLALVEDRLGGVTDLIQSVRARLVEAGGGTLTDGDRRAIAAEIRQRYDEAVSLANSTDGDGQYLFSGYRGATPPIAVAGTPGSRTVTYNGDDGQRLLQVENGRQMSVSHPGSDLFMGIRQGNGIFMSSPGAANQGTGIISTGSVISGFDGSTYALTFTSATTYDLTVTPPGGGPATTTPGFPYTSGSAIVLGPSGPPAQQFQVSIEGAPSAGDTFSVAPTTNQDLFSTIDQFIKALETPSQGNPALQTSFRNQLVRIGDSMDQALENVLRVRTDIGARMLALDSMTTVGQEVDLQYKSNLSQLQDLDYAKAITDMSRQQMTLEAAQISFKKTSELSLFNIL